MKTSFRLTTDPGGHWIAVSARSDFAAVGIGQPARFQMRAGVVVRVLNALSRWRDAVRSRHELQAAERALRELSAHTLRDLGIEVCEVTPRSAQAFHIVAATGWRVG